MNKEVSLFWEIAIPIITGKSAAGEVLPSYTALADRNRISVNTVDRVMFSLRMSGFIEGRQGENTYVSDRWKMSWKDRIRLITTELDITSLESYPSLATPAAEKRYTLRTLGTRMDR